MPWTITLYSNNIPAHCMAASFPAPAIKNLTRVYMVGNEMKSNIEEISNYNPGWLPGLKYSTVLGFDAAANNSTTLKLTFKDGVDYSPCGS